MPPTLPADGAAPSAADQAAELNERIRAFWMGPLGHPTLKLTDEQREEYHGLLAELERVKRGGIATAA